MIITYSSGMSSLSLQKTASSACEHDPTFLYFLECGRRRNPNRDHAAAILAQGAIRRVERHLQERRAPCGAKRSRPSDKRADAGSCRKWLSWKQSAMT